MYVLVKSSNSAIIIDASVIEFGLESNPEVIKIWDHNDNYVIVNLPYHKDMVAYAELVMNTSYPVIDADSWVWEDEE